jgi:hypothetical protein
MKINLVSLAWWWLWLWCAGAVAASVLKFAHKQWFAGVLLAVIGAAAITMVTLYARALSQLEAPLEAGGSGERIVMRMSSEAVAKWLAWAAGFLVAAIVFVYWPDILWTKWLSYPASPVALGLCGLMLTVAFNAQLQRVVADAQGIEVRQDVRGASETQEKVAWAQVGAVKRVAVYAAKMSHSSGGGNLLRREFVLLDREGAELLNLEEPLEPPERYQQFLESVPRWTGLAVQETRVH